MRSGVRCRDNDRGCQPCRDRYGRDRADGADGADERTHDLDGDDFAVANGPERLVREEEEQQCGERGSRVRQGQGIDGRSDVVATNAHTGPVQLYA